MNGLEDTEPPAWRRRCWLCKLAEDAARASLAGTRSANSSSLVFCAPASGRLQSAGSVADDRALRWHNTSSSRNSPVTNHAVGLDTAGGGLHNLFPASARIAGPHSCCLFSGTCSRGI